MGRIEKPATETALALFDNLTPDKVYTPGGVDAVLAKIFDEVRKTVVDVSTKAGREAAKSLAYKVARSKTLLDDMGKGLVADWKAKASLVDAERKTIRDRLDALKDEVKKPVDEWEQAESDRVAAHITAIQAIEEQARFLGEPSSEMVAGRLTALERMISRDWQEFADQAATVVKFARSKLADMKDAAIKREADAFELEALRAEKAERDRKDQEEQAKREAAERARIAEETRQRQEREAAERAEQAARDAVEAERRRVADQEATERAAEQKREQNKKHRAKINNEVLAAFVGKGVDPEIGKALIAAIARGEIPHTKIGY